MTKVQVSDLRVGDRICTDPSYPNNNDDGYSTSTVVHVGDDRKFTFEPDDLTPIEREAYCGSCGQIGCGHDGLERGDA